MRKVERLEFADPDDVTRFMDSVVHDPPLSAGGEREVLATLPKADPDEPIMVVHSVRLPVELAKRVREAAEDEGMTVSEFIRTGIASVMAGRDRSNLVNLDDVIRAVRSLPHAA